MSFLNNLYEATNYTLTENGALAHKTTQSAVYDMFAMGGAMRRRSNADVIVMFKKAYDEDKTYALKCLFYLRDILEGQGERRFFRVCLKWVADYDTEHIRPLVHQIPIFGRWDDLFCFANTKLEKDAFDFIKVQLATDIQSKTPSLLGKWLPSENTSSAKTKAMAIKMRKYLNMSARQYRKTLTELRKRINVLECLMSANRWDEIEFDKIPSKAGLKYRNAFARHDVERVKEGKKTYEEFIKDTNTKVNAKALYPYEVVEKAIHLMHSNNYWCSDCCDTALDNTKRLAINKYWDNLTDYFNGQSLNALAVVDTSGSMLGQPINIAVSLGLYCAERAKGPFANHYVSFSSHPLLVQTVGVDFCDKVDRIVRTDLCENTNIEATFDLLLKTAINNNCSQEDLPENIIVISDMEFDVARRWTYHYNMTTTQTLMECISDKWAAHGYKMPKLIFWNVEARHDNIPMKDKDGITFVSGANPITFQMVLSGKTGQDLMYDKLDSERYKEIK